MTGRSPRRRLDDELVRRNLADDVTEARHLIEVGRARVGGAPARNPARLVAAQEAVALTAAPPRYVGRGGAKLAAALERFAVPVDGARVLDAGSSTGGFTDCALQSGATEVVAVDVGRGQLHQRLRLDDRVSVHEQTNIRHVDPRDLGGRADVVVADLSFISLRTVADALLTLTRPGGHLVVLVKPQFEATRAEATAAGGVITDPDIWHRVLAETSDALVARRAAIMGAMASPLHGADGNVEFFLHAVAPAMRPNAPDDDAGATCGHRPVESLLAEALSEAMA